MNEEMFQQECERIAAEIVEDFDLVEVDLYDAVSELVDSHSWVIYTQKHRDIVFSSDVDIGRGEQFVVELAEPLTVSGGMLNNLSQRLVYGEMIGRVFDAAKELLAVE